MRIKPVPSIPGRASILGVYSSSRSASKQPATAASLLSISSNFDIDSNQQGISRGHKLEGRVGGEQSEEGRQESRVY
jgi:hypothetical protein